MKTTRCHLDGILIIEPMIHSDHRGFFLECYEASRYRENGVSDQFVQDNHSRSHRGVLRGLHFRCRQPQAQLLTVMHGQIFDVVVDIRPNSPTFGQWLGTELGDNGPRQIYMAAGFAHGFCVLSEVADLHYKVSRPYDSQDEAGLVWNDPDIAIAWPVSHPVVSDRDAAHPRLRDSAMFVKS